MLRTYWWECVIIPCFRSLLLSFYLFPFSFPFSYYFNKTNHSFSLMQQTKSKLRRCMVVYIFKLRWVLIMKSVYFLLCVLTPIRSNTLSSCIYVYLCLCHYMVTPKSSKLMENNAMICVSTCTPFFIFIFLRT